MLARRFVILRSEKALRTKVYSAPLIFGSKLFADTGSLKNHVPGILGKIIVRDQVRIISRIACTTAVGSGIVANGVVSAGDIDGVKLKDVWGRRWIEIDLQ